MRLPLPRAIAGVLLATACLIGTPRVASACIFNPLHFFAPTPPCGEKDNPAITKLTRANVMLAGKLATIGVKSAYVAQEIRGWAGAVYEARLFEESMRQLSGEITADPLPSLVSSFNEAGLPLSMEIGPNGTLRLATTYQDIQSQADSVLHATLLNPIGFDSVFKDVNTLQAINVGQQFRTLRMMGAGLQDMYDYKRAVDSVRKKLLADGNQYAARYTTDAFAGAKGEAEANISLMSATLSRMRATATLAQARSNSARIRALRDAQALSGEMARIRFRTNPAVVR